MTKESGRKCSHCGINGHNSRTCNEKVVHNHQHVKLFGVRILNTGGDESVKKSMSMGNLHACNTTNGDHQNSNSDHGYLSDGGLLIRSGRSEAVHHERRRGVPWTEEEHKTFLAGLEKLGKGDWRGISRNFVTTRTPTQVASHAQKYFLRQATPNKKGRRSSLFDVSLEDPPAALHSPINPSDSIPTEQPTTAAATTTSTAAAENSSEAPPATPVATPSLTCSQVPTSSYHGITPPSYMVGISGGGRLGYTAQSSPSPSNFTFPAVSLVPVMNFPINHGYYCVPNQMRSYIPSNTTYGLPVAPPHHSQIAPSSYQHCYRPQVATSSSTSLSPTPLPSSVASTPLLNDQSVNTDLALSIAPPRPQDREKLLSQTSNLGGAISVL